MAILKGNDGKFYEVPEDQLENFEIPAEDVKQKLEEAGGPAGGGRRRGGAPAGSPQVLVQVYGGPGGKGGRKAAAGQAGAVQPYGYCGYCYCGYCYCGYCY